MRSPGSTTQTPDMRAQRCFFAMHSSYL